MTMFCDKKNVNQLTALLKSYSITDIVVCPGSRNAIIINNLSLCKSFNVYTAIDERSAGFIALGITLSTMRPCAVCVTSGSAITNLYPALAEAKYRKVSIIAISADRPNEWIEQQDGQTLMQENLFGNLNIKTYQLSNQEDKLSIWKNNRILNEAFNSLNKEGGTSIHINVPIAEPMFSFTTHELPDERVIKTFNSNNCYNIEAFKEIEKRISNARFPIMIVGQIDENVKNEIIQQIENQNSILILPEVISKIKGSWRNCYLEELLPDEKFNPDLILYLGGGLINKKIKLFLRSLNQSDCIRIGEEENFIDTFCNTTMIVNSSTSQAFDIISHFKNKENQIVVGWKKRLDTKIKKPELQFSDLYCVNEIHNYLKNNKLKCIIQSGNSQSIRNIHIIFNQKDETAYPIFCNRGINGIEGSLSTAVGFSVKSGCTTLCFIGDLSFFYDANGLWNDNITGNLKIIVFNNGGGQIFKSMQGIKALDTLPLIAGGNNSSAKGLCESYKIKYLTANNSETLNDAIESLFKKTNEPQLLEIFTNSSLNVSELNAYKKSITSQISL